MGHFFPRCLKTVFNYPLWEKGHAIAAAIICVLGLIAYLASKFLPTLQEHEVKDWQILFFAFIGIIPFRLIASPYWVYRQTEYERDKYRKKLQQLHKWEEALEEMKNGTL